MKRKLTALFLLAAMLLAAALPALAAETRTFTDDVGRAVEVPAEITRLAPSGTAAQIILFALAPEMFVGLAGAWSAEAEAFLGDYYSLPVLGQLYGATDLNLEALAAADPQIVIDLGEPKKDMAEALDTLETQISVPAVHIDAATASFADAYRKAGDLLGLQERAEALAVYCEETYARAEDIMAQVGDDRLTLLYSLGADGLSVIAKDSYHGEIIDMVSDNLAVVENPSSKGTGNAVDMEQLLLWDPEVIVFAPETDLAAIVADPAWQSLQAIANGRYIQVPFGPYNWMGFPPSVQRYLGLLWLCDTFYPEESGYDLYTEVATYFDLFYHHDLTEAEFEQLTQHSFFPAA